ncbi:MAG: helix-turn-helix domain-containing protein [Leadbetterella sp.]|nr:helix-turn-helix domain-containing protein [Leadbetterella sp.]
MTVSVLYTRNHRLLSLVAIVDVFETVNQFMKEDGRPAAFGIQLVGLEPDMVLPESLENVRYVPLAEASADGGIIVIPAFRDHEMEKNIQANLPFIPWVLENYGKQCKVTSCCTGSFLLGATGLLNGREATTHMEACDAFARNFPDVRLVPHAIVTSSQNVYTSGGATSTFHLLIHLIQETCGREYAVRLAKNFAIDMDRSNQLYFEKFVPELSREDELVRQVQQVINARYRDLKNVEEALEEIPSSRRNIVRRFKTATGMTPIRYLQKTKIESAKQLLETTNKDILEVMISSGYQDLKNFRELFKNFTGLTPKGYRDKYAMGLQA